MSEMMIFNDMDELLCIASNVEEETLHFNDAKFTERLNTVGSLEFISEPTHEDSQHVKNGNQAAFLDKDDDFRLFRLTHVEKEVVDLDGNTKAWGDEAFFELEKNILEDIRPRNVSLGFALERALSGQDRWKPGEVAPLGNNSANFFYISSLEALEQIAEAWGAEIRARVEIDGSRITGRYIDMISRGADTGLVMEVGHNVSGLSLRTESAHICTLLYGRGSGLPNYDEETGMGTGGFTRRIMFTDLEATQASHGFVKPSGQSFLVDDAAKEIYGLVSANGERIHLEGVHTENSIEDPDELMRATWHALQMRNKPHYHARCDVILLADLLGDKYAHEQLRLGDVIRLADYTSFARPILLQSRVIRYTYHLDDFTKGTVELANFRSLDTNASRVNRLESGLNAGVWNRPSIIGPGNIANVVPQQVTRLQAIGEITHIDLTWHNQGLLVASYELHASEIEDFIPDESNLIYRGVISAHTHRVEPATRWYYRCRAINHHGVSGEWSEQVYAQTEDIYDPYNPYDPDALRALAVVVGRVQADILEVRSEIGAVQEQVEIAMAEMEVLASR